jgi:hypothetical protein
MIESARYLSTLALVYPKSGSWMWKQSRSTFSVSRIHRDTVKFVISGLALFSPLSNFLIW